MGVSQKSGSLLGRSHFNLRVRAHKEALAVLRKLQASFTQNGAPGVGNFLKRRVGVPAAQRVLLYELRPISSPPKRLGLGFRVWGTCA